MRSHGITLPALASTQHFDHSPASPHSGHQSTIVHSSVSETVGIAKRLVDSAITSTEHKPTSQSGLRSCCLPHALRRLKQSRPPVPGVARQPLPVGDEAVQEHALVLRVRDAGRRPLLAEERAVLVDVGEVRRVAAWMSCAHQLITSSDAANKTYAALIIHCLRAAAPGSRFDGLTTEQT